MAWKHTRVLRVRYKDGPDVRSKLFLSADPKKLKGRVPGKVLKVGKVSYEELFHIGSANRLPETLMKEFRRGRNVKSGLDQDIEKSSKEVVNARRRTSTRDKQEYGQEYGTGG